VFLKLSTENWYEIVQYAVLLLSPHGSRQLDNTTGLQQAGILHDGHSARDKEKRNAL
jgi:hypothetical protein